MDTRSLAWFFRNALHVADGGFLRRTMYFSTVDLDTVIPIFASSPTMRGEPQVALADDIRRMEPRSFGGPVTDRQLVPTPELE